VNFKGKKRPFEVILFVYEKEIYIELKKYDSYKSKAEFFVEPAKSYAILVIQKSGKKVDIFHTQFKAVFSLQEMDQLYQKAESFVKNKGSFSFSKFYRCKPSEYWDELDDSTMVPYIKDSSGHKQSPINGQLRGLFFSTKDGEHKGRPHFSNFGNKCLGVYASTLFDPERINAYFADFYCSYNG
jgi:hypothetical protein